MFLLLAMISVAVAVGSGSQKPIGLTAKLLNQWHGKGSSVFHKLTATAHCSCHCSGNNAAGV
jgi:hypothetical protein